MIEEFLHPPALQTDSGDTIDHYRRFGCWSVTKDGIKCIKIIPLRISCFSCLLSFVFYFANSPFSLSLHSEAVLSYPASRSAVDTLTKTSWLRLHPLSCACILSSPHASMSFKISSLLHVVAIGCVFLVKRIAKSHTCSYPLHEEYKVHITLVNGCKHIQISLHLLVVHKAIPIFSPHFYVIPINIPSSQNFISLYAFIVCQKSSIIY